MITKSRPKLFMDTKTSEGDETFRTKIKSQAGETMDWYQEAI